MDRLFLISVLDNNLSDNEVSMDSVLKWSYDNINTDFVVAYTESELSQLISETQIINIINSESKYFISLWEDSIICSSDIKEKILNKLLCYFANTEKFKVETFKFIGLFEYAIKMKKCIYFLF